MIKPFFDNNKITIVFSVDNNFFPLLAVAIESIIIHSTINNKYDINILCEEFLSLDKQNKIIRQAENIDNINIRFINISSITDRYDNNIFYTRRSFTKAAYYRLFIPEVFNDYERAVYFDCDIILQCDAAELFNIDLQGNTIAAARDLPVMSTMNSKCSTFIEWRKYLENNILGLKSYKNYFQSAVMIFDIKKIEADFTKKAINELIRVKTPYAVEQCILNIMFEDKVKILDWSWNYNCCWYEYTYRYLPQNLKKELNNAKKHPKIIHFSGFKPYEYADKNSKEHKIFWNYAQKTEFYEDLMNLKRQYIISGKIIRKPAGLLKKIILTIKYGLIRSY